MSNIIKRPELTLSVSENRLMNALSQPMMKDLSPRQKDVANVALIGGVFANVNEKNPEDAVLLKMRSDLRELMDSEFKAMRLDEIKIALDWGADNWEGHGVSSKLIKSWIRTWRTSRKLEIQKSIAIKQKNLPKQKPRELTNDEKITSIENEFHKHLKGQKVLVKIYGYLESFGYEVTPQMKFEAIDKAIPKLILETKENRNEWIAGQVKSRLKELRECDPKKPIPIVIVEAQRIIITDLFDKCLEECITIVEFLKLD